MAKPPVPSPTAPSSLYTLLRDALADTNSWLNFAEAKNGVLFALDFAMAGVLIGTIVGDHPVVGPISAGIKAAITAVLIAGGFSLASLFARTLAPKDHLDSETPGNLFFFSNNAKHSAASYLTAFQAKAGTIDPPDGLDADLAAQVVNNSRVAVTKFALFNVALIVSVVSIVVPGLWVLFQVITS